jgi:hypothetical protein
MSYNALRDAKYIKNSPLCKYDSLDHTEFKFPVDGDVNGWDLYTDIAVYGSYNGVLFGSATDRSCYIGRSSNFSSIECENFYLVKIMMKITDNNQSKPGISLTTAKIQWTTLQDGIWDSYKQETFEIYSDDQWHLYVLELGPNQYWKGNVNNLRIYPFTNAYVGDLFAIKYVKISSEDYWVCSNTQCSYYSNYEHPCPGVGVKACITAGIGKETYTVSGTNDKFTVNIDGYGNEEFSLGEQTNVNGMEMARVISNKLSNLNVGGYAYVEVEHSDGNKLKITSGYAGSDSSISIPDSVVARELGFYDYSGSDVSTHVAGVQPATGYESASSRLLTALEINRLIDGDSHSVAYVHTPKLYNVEGGRSDFNTAGIGNLLSDLFSGEYYYSSVVNRGKTIIDLSHPFNSNGKVKVVNVCGKVEGLDQAKVFIVRPYKNGNLKVIHSLNVEQKQSTQYTRNPNSYRVDCDIMVKKGDLIGVYNMNLYVGRARTGYPDATFYFINGEASGVFDPGPIYSFGTAGFPIYARGDSFQTNAVLDIDFGKRVNVESINLYGEEESDYFEFNIARCLDVDWEVDLHNGKHTHRHYGGPTIHWNRAYGLDALSDGVLTADNGKVGTSWGRNASTGLWTSGEHSYFYVNGDDEFVGVDPDASALGEGIGMTDSSGDSLNSPAEDFEYDPVTLTLVFAYNVPIKVFKSIMYFKERTNFRNFELSYYLGSTINGNSATGRDYNKIPYYTNIKLDGVAVTDDNPYIFSNPTYEDPIYQYGNYSCVNWQEVRAAIYTDWVKIEHEFDPVSCYGFRIHCTKHKSTKITELEVYSRFDTETSLIDNASVLFSKHGDVWEASGFEEISSGKVSSFVGNAPRYITLEIDSNTYFFINEIEAEVGDQIKLQDCGTNLYLDNSKTNVVNESSSISIRNTYDRPLNLSVDIPKEAMLTDSIIFWNTLSSYTEVDNSEVGPGCYFYKRDGFDIMNREGQCAINIPCYGLKNLVHGKTGYYLANESDHWEEWGTLASGVSINYGNDGGHEKVSLEFPITSSKYWKINVYDSEGTDGYIEGIRPTFLGSQVDPRFVYIQANHLDNNKIQTQLNDNNSIPHPRVFLDRFDNGVYNDEWTEYKNKSGNLLVEKDDRLGFSFIDGVDDGDEENTYIYVEKEFDNPFVSFELDLCTSTVDSNYEDVYDQELANGYFVYGGRRVSNSVNKFVRNKIIFLNESDEELFHLEIKHDAVRIVKRKANKLEHEVVGCFLRPRNIGYGDSILAPVDESGFNVQDLYGFYNGSLKIKKIYDYLWFESGDGTDAGYYPTQSSIGYLTKWFDGYYRHESGGWSTDYVYKVRIVWENISKEIHSLYGSSYSDFNAELYGDWNEFVESSSSHKYYAYSAIDFIDIKALPVLSVDESMCLEFDVSEELDGIDVYGRDLKNVLLLVSSDDVTYNPLTKNFDDYTGDLTHLSKAESSVPEYYSEDWWFEHTKHAFDDKYSGVLFNDYNPVYSVQDSWDATCWCGMNPVSSYTIAHFVASNSLLRQYPLLTSTYVNTNPWVGIDFGHNKRKIKQVKLAFFSDESDSSKRCVKVQASNDYESSVSIEHFTLASGNLNATYVSNLGGRIIDGTVGVSTGKWYWEGTVDDGTVGFGIGTSELDLGGSMCANEFGWRYLSGYKCHDAFSEFFGTGVESYYGVGATIGVALDMNEGKVWFSKNGSWIGMEGDDPSSGFNPAFSSVSGTVYPMFYLRNNSEMTASFSPGGFMYTVPSGFVGVSGTLNEAHASESLGMDWWESKTWTTLASVDGLTSSTIDYNYTTKDWPEFIPEWNDITFSNSTYYRYYRLYFDDPSTIVKVYEVQMMEDFTGLCSSDLSVTPLPYSQYFAIDLEQVHRLDIVRNYGQAEIETYAGSRVKDLLDVGIGKGNLVLSDTDTSDIYSVVWGDSSPFIDEFDDGVYLDNWSLGGTSGSSMVEAGGKIYVSDYGVAGGSSYGPNMTHSLSGAAYDFDLLFYFNMVSSDSQAGKYKLELLDNSDVVVVRFNCYKESYQSVVEELYVREEDSLTKVFTATGHLSMTISNKVQIVRSSKEDLITYKVNDVILYSGVMDDDSVYKLKITYEKYFGVSSPSDHSTSYLYLSTAASSLDSRWLKIEISFGRMDSGLGSYIRKLGIYPDITMSVAPGGGSYNCEWENLGTGLTYPFYDLMYGWGRLEDDSSFGDPDGTYFKPLMEVSDGGFRVYNPDYLGINVAYGSSVSTNSYHQEYYPNYTVNGDTTGGMDGEQAWGFDFVGEDSPYIDIDLGYSCFIDKVKVFHGRHDGDNRYLNTSKQYYYIYNTSQTSEILDCNKVYVDGDVCEYTFEDINITASGTYFFSWQLYHETGDSYPMTYELKDSNGVTQKTITGSNSTALVSGWVFFGGYASIDSGEEAVYDFVSTTNILGSNSLVNKWGIRNLSVRKVNPLTTMTQYTTKPNEFRTSPYCVYVSTTVSGEDFVYAYPKEKLVVEYISMGDYQLIEDRYYTYQAGNKYERVYYLQPVRARRVRIVFNEWDTTPYWFLNSVSGEYEVFRGSFVREIEIYKYDGIFDPSITNEDWPVVALDMKTRFNIASVKLLVGLNYIEDLSNIRSNTWWNYDVGYSDNVHSEPEKVSFVRAGSGDVFYFSNESSGIILSGYVSENRENIEYSFDTDVYLSEGNYSLSWDVYYPSDEYKTSLRLDGPEILDYYSAVLSSGVEWVSQTDTLVVNESGYYDIKGRQHKNYDERWGIRYPVISRVSNDENRWVYLECDTATNYTGDRIKAKGVTYYDKPFSLGKVSVTGTTKYSITKCPWWWNSIVSDLEADYFNVKEDENSLKVSYPDMTRSDFVYFVEQSNFGHDWNWTINDFLTFWWYIEDVDKLNTSIGDVSFGDFHMKSEMVSVGNGLSHYVFDDAFYYTWNISDLTLQTGWNKIRLKFEDYSNVYPIDENSIFGSSSFLDDLLNLSDNGRNYRSFGIRYKGKGEAFTMNLTDVKIERNVFDEDVKFGKGLCLDNRESLEIPLSNLDLRKGTIEFWIKLYCDSSGRNHFGDVSSKTLFTITNNSNETISLGIKSGKYFELVVGRIVEGLFESDVSVRSFADAFYEIGDVVHLAVVWSNDGYFMDNDDTMRLYINNNLAFSILDVWEVSDTKSANIRFGGTITEMALNSDSLGSAIFHNIKIYNYCKTSFNIIDEDIDQLELFPTPNDFVEISSDDNVFYGVGSSNLPLCFEQVPASGTRTVYVRSNKTDKFIHSNKKTANLDVEWQVIV